MRPLIPVALSLCLIPTATFATAHAAAKPKGPSVVAKGVAGPMAGADGFNVDINARTVKGRTSGTFRGAVMPGYMGTSAPEVFSITGPVTCLSVKGNAAGVLYPVEKATAQGQSVPGEQASILITVVKGVGGADDMLGFTGPLPNQAFTNCDPGMAPFVFTGTLRISS